MLGIKEGILKIIRDDGNGPYLYFREVVWKYEHEIWN
jgi:hypothetical protein